jgi:hypothetical protein
MADWSPLSAVRLLITDTDSSRPIFQDEEVNAFLSLTVDSQTPSGKPFIAAAFALDTIATNEALCEKALTILGLQIDGPALSKELRARAVQLRDDYMKYVNADPLFTSAEFADGVFQDTEEVYKQYLRSSFGLLGYT